MRVFSDRLFESSTGGATAVCWGGGQSLGAGGNSGGQQWGCLQTLRTALRTISISPKTV